jgi:drug/metabolite transporter (DMT)-like permease
MAPMGELSALGSALFWAINSLLVRSQTGRISAIPLNAIQYSFAAIFFLIILFPTGRMSLILEIAPVWMAALIASALIGMAGGDSMYVKSLGLIGVTRAFPIATSGYLLLTFVVAIVFLGESLGLLAVGGGVAVIVGISLIALSSPQDRLLTTDDGGE